MCGNAIGVIKALNLALRRGYVNHGDGRLAHKWKTMSTHKFNLEMKEIGGFAWVNPREMCRYRQYPSPAWQLHRLLQCWLER